MQEIIKYFNKKLANGFIWTLASILALQGSVVITGIFLARTLGLNVFGIFAITTTTVLTVAGVVQGGVGILGVKFVGEWLNTNPQRISRLLHMCEVFTFTTGVAGALFLWLSADLIAIEILNRAEVAPYLEWISISIFFYVQIAYMQGVLQGFSAFRSLSIANMQSGIVYLVSLSASAYMYDLHGAVVAFVLSAMFRWLCLKYTLKIIRLKHDIKNIKGVGRENWILIWQFVLPAGLASYITLPCLWMVTMAIARLPNGASLVGLFAISHQLRQIVMQLPIMLNTVSSSALGRLKGLGEKVEFWKAFRVNLILGVSFTIVTVAILIMLLPYVIGLYGEQFLGAHDLALLLLIAVIPEVAGINAYQLVQSSGRMWRSLFFIVAPRDIIYLALSFLLINSCGLVGAGAAYLVAHIYGLLATLTVGLYNRDWLKNQ